MKSEFDMMLEDACNEPTLAKALVTAKSLPWICPEHPMAQIKHSWDEGHYIMNGYPVGQGIKSNHLWECAECGLKLKPD